MAIDSANEAKFQILTPPFEESKYQGNLCTVYDQRTRHVLAQSIAKEELEVGVFITIDGLHPLDQAAYVTKPRIDNQKILGMSVRNKVSILKWDAVLKCYKYPIGEEVNYATTGDWYMYSEIAVSKLDDVYYRITADGANTRIGALSNAAGTGLVKHPTAQFAEFISEPGLVAVTLGAN